MVLDLESTRQQDHIACYLIMFPQADTVHSLWGNENWNYRHFTLVSVLDSHDAGRAVYFTFTSVGMLAVNAKFPQARGP